MLNAVLIPGKAPRPRAIDVVRSPYDGASLGDVELADADDVQAAVDVQRRLFADRGARIALHERTAILRRAAALVRDEHELLSLQIAREGGKPLVDARVEVTRAAFWLEWLAGDAERQAGVEVPLGATPATAGRLAFTTREPIGVVAAVSAFNHPVNLIAHQVGPAVAAGCPVIIKPARQTPLSCFALLDILRRAGLPPGWCIALPCDDAVAESLVTSERIAYFSFIGSARVGWMLRGKLAPGVRCGLEHGGAAPVIVDESADLAHALPLIVKGGYYHAGQVCVSVQRVYVHRARHDEFVEALSSAVGRLVVGDPTKLETEVGPLIRASEVQRVHAWLGEAVAGGAKVVVGGRLLDHQCYAPSVVTGASDTASVMQAEVFGPVVSVVAFDELDDAVRRANGVRWAFQAAVFTRDIDRALSCAERLDASSVMINDHSAFRADWMPFGGRRESGLGLAGSPHSLAELTESKLVVLRRRA